MDGDDGAGLEGALKHDLVGSGSRHGLGFSRVGAGQLNLWMLNGEEATEGEKFAEGE